MAEEVAIGTTGQVAKVRGPVAVVLLTLVTLGIYGIVWYYKLNKELAAIGRERNTDELGDNPMTSLLAITLGALVIVPAVISLINTFKRVQAAQRLSGITPVSGAVGIVLAIFVGPVLYGYMQSGMNDAIGRISAVTAPSASPALAAA